MDIPTVLELIDEVVYAKTNKHLTDLQRIVVEGTLKQQTYSTIGETNGFSEGHIKDVGYELLRVLSDIFGEDVTKRNFKSVIQRNLNITDNSFSNGSMYINIYPDRPSPSPPTSPPETSEYDRTEHKVKMATAKKLKQRGISDREIAELLDLSLEQVGEIADRG